MRVEADQVALLQQNPSRSGAQHPPTTTPGPKLLLIPALHHSTVPLAKVRLKKESERERWGGEKGEVGGSAEEQERGESWSRAD